MAKQVLDIHPGKGMTVSQSNEHLRVAFRGAYLAKLSGNFDPTREHLNFEVQKGGIITPLDKKNSIPKRIKETLKKRGIVDPNKGMKNPFYRTVANIILGGSRDQMHRLAYGFQVVDLEKGANNSQIVRMPDIEKWAIDMYKFMSKKYGEDNIAAFVVHLDETNPHVHCTLLPINEKNRFSWNQYFGGFKENGRKKFLDLHNAISEINSKYGLERGDAIAETGAKHRTTAQFRAEMSRKLREENIALASEITKKKEVRSQLDKDIIHASARLKGIQTMITNLETRQADLEANIQILEKSYAEGKISKDVFDNKIQLLRKRIEVLEEKKADKIEKLKVAQDKLDMLQKSIEEKDEKLSEVSTSLKQKRAELSRNVNKDFREYAFVTTCAGMKERLERFQENLQSLTPEQRSLIENVNKPLFEEGPTLNVGEIAEGGTDITAIATNLFMGYIDNATALSQGGGGGGGPTGGWGKRDDEDDKAYKRRCFAMAHRMRKGGRSVGGGRKR